MACVGIEVLVVDLVSDLGGYFLDIDPWTGLGLWLGLFIAFGGVIWVELGTTYVVFIIAAAKLRDVLQRFAQHRDVQQMGTQQEVVHQSCPFCQFCGFCNSFLL